MMASQTLDTTERAEQGKQAEQAELKDMSVSEVSRVDSAGRRVAREVQRKLKWKLDLFILPLVASVYFLASMVWTTTHSLLFSPLACHAIS